MWYVWLILAGIFFVAEILTVGFLVFWLGIGALIAMLVSFFTDSLVIQMTVFVISSTILIIATKPLVKKLTQKDKTVVTNAFSIGLGSLYWHGLYCDIMLRISLALCADNAGTPSNLYFSPSFSYLYVPNV